MTAGEAYELITMGGATDFARLIAACERFGSYCLIGDLAVNCCVEPVYTLDVDLVVLAASLPGPTAHLAAQTFPSQLRIRFTTDERYQSFPARSAEADVLGIRAKIACREDVTRGKLWAYADPRRRLSKWKKDELDLIRLAEAYPELKARCPAELREQLERG
jgi:hypothetical protein